jgi:hypothetical protein
MKYASKAARNKRIPAITPSSCSKASRKTMKLGLLSQDKTLMSTSAFAAKKQIKKIGPTKLELKKSSVIKE